MVGMMLQNLSAHDVRIPARTAIGNVQSAKVVPSLKVPNYTSEILPSMEQTELLQVSWPTCLIPLKLS